MEMLNFITGAIGWTLIHSLWQGAVLYLFLSFILRFNPGLTSKWKHNLSCLTLFAIFLWMLITLSLQLSSTIHPGEVTDSSSVLNAGTTGNIQTRLPTAIVPAIERNIRWLVLLYAIGVMVQAAFFFVNCYKIQRLRTGMLTNLSSKLHQRFLELAASAGITKQIRFNISAEVSVPIVFGYMKPIVLFPFSVVTRLGTEQLEAIILHELAHVRRHDYLINLFKVFIEAVLFFNPFVILISSIIDTERENACDDFVVQVTGKPLVYAETLFHIQELKAVHPGITLAISGQNYRLLNRIKRIAGGDPGKFRLRLPAGLFVILAALFTWMWLPAQYEKMVATRPPVPGKALLGKAALQKIAATIEVPDNLNTLLKKRERSSARTNQALSKNNNPAVSSAEPVDQLSESTPEIKMSLPDQAQVIAVRETGGYPTDGSPKQPSGIQIDKDGKITMDGIQISRIRVSGEDYPNITSAKDLPPDVVNILRKLDDVVTLESGVTKPIVPQPGAALPN